MDLLILHYNERYRRNWKQMWHVTCGLTFSQSCGVKQYDNRFKEAFYFMQKVGHVQYG